MPRKVITLGIADDVWLDQALIEYNIKAIKNTKILFRSANGHDLLFKIKHFNPQILILDIYMPLMNGLESIHELRKLNYPGKIICTTAGYEPNLIERLQELNVEGFARKHNNQITKAIQEIVAGRTYYDGEFASKNTLITPTIREEIEINGKEIEIINKLAIGQSSKEIATEFGTYTPETIDTYIKNMLDRFHLKNRTHLVSFALTYGLIYNFDFLYHYPGPKHLDIINTQ